MARQVATKETERNRQEASQTQDLQQRIAQKAYELYEQSGRVEGRDLDNWLEAERAVRQQFSSRT